MGVPVLKMTASTFEYRHTHTRAMGMPSAMPIYNYGRWLGAVDAWLERDRRHSVRPHALHSLYRLYLGIADGLSIARVWVCRYSK